MKDYVIFLSGMILIIITGILFPIFLINSLINLSKLVAVLMVLGFILVVLGTPNLVSDDIKHLEYLEELI